MPITPATAGHTGFLGFRGHYSVIPAPAGHTEKTPKNGLSYAGYPCICGAHERKVDAIWQYFRLPPRTRGTLGRVAVSVVHAAITPAHSGHTSPSHWLVAVTGR